VTDTEQQGVAPSTEGHRGTTDDLGAFVPGPRALVRGASDGPLCGLRFAVKDLFDVAGTRTGGGNPTFLEDAVVAEHHAPTVAALLGAGADLVGKTITDELAFSLSGTNIHYGTPMNVAAPGRVPGGSSSGSAAAVAGGLVEFALGTDTGGSIRVPASYCGIFGIRPTHGRITDTGVLPLAPSFDTVGVLATSGGVLERIWSVLAERAGDPSWTPPASGVPPRPRDNATVATLVCPPELLALLDPESRFAFEPAADALGRALGCRVIERRIVPPEELERIVATFRAVQLAEAWIADGDWIERRHPDLGPGVRGRFEAARAADPSAIATLAQRREDVGGVLRAALGEDELLIQPAAAGPAHRIELAGPDKDDLRQRTLTLTSFAGVAGAPVVSIPVARVGELPLGIALVGLPGEDELVVSCAARWSAEPSR